MREGSSRESIYRDIFSWAFRTGMAIRRVDQGDKLLKQLIYHIRGEETPGRFIDKLSERLTEYRTNTSITADVNLHPEIIKRRWHGDSFHYMRASVLSGFLNALSASKSEGGD